MFNHIHPNLTFSAARGLGEADLSKLLTGEAQRRRTLGRPHRGDATAAGRAEALLRARVGMA